MAGAGDVTEVVELECLPSMHGTLGLIPSINPSTWKMETGRSKIQGHPQLYKEFKASLGYLDFVFF